MPSDQPTSSPAYLDDGRLTQRQFYIASLASGGLFLDGYNLLVLSGSLLGLIPYFHLAPATIGIITAMAFAGMVVGSFVAGPIIDRVGRRPVFVVDMLLFMVAAGLCLWITSPLQLIILRFVTGVAIGADLPTSNSIIAEFSTRTTRGPLQQLTGPWWNSGTLIAAIVSLLVYHLGSLADWRWILASGFVPALLVLILRRNMPETPRWLLSKGRTNEGLQIYKDTTGQELDARQATAAVAADVKGRVLFHGRAAYLLIFVSAFWFIENWYGSSLLLYSPVIIKSIVTPNPFTALEFTATITLLFVLTGVWASLKAVESYGRRALAFWPSLIMGVALLVLAWLIHIPAVVLPAIAVASMCDYGCIANVYFVWASELFPTAVRGQAVGISNGLGKMGSLLGVLTFPSIFAISPVLAFVILAGLVFVGAAVVYFMAPETKGQSLDLLEKAVLS